jgi:RNA polymerase sigma factor (sigma-70 family)
MFEKGVRLSKSFNTRTQDETYELYDLIKDAVLCAQNPQNMDSDKALQFVVQAFDPLIRKVASRIYLHVKDFEEFEDTLQEAYVTFINLVYGYDPNIATFPYYIRNMLPRQVKAWSQKTRKRTSTPVDVVIVDNALVDPAYDNKDSVYERYNSMIFQKEYEDFILERAEKKAKSDTVKEVCYNYFLGAKSCSTIAMDLGISYHAVYEVLQRVKRELQDFMQDSCFADPEFWKHI